MDHASEMLLLIKYLTIESYNLVDFVYLVKLALAGIPIVSPASNFADSDQMAFRFGQMLQNHSRHEFGQDIKTLPRSDT